MGVGEKRKERRRRKKGNKGGEGCGMRGIDEKERGEGVKKEKEDEQEGRI